MERLKLIPDSNYEIAFELGYFRPANLNDGGNEGEGGEEEIKEVEDEDEFEGNDGFR